MAVGYRRILACFLAAALVAPQALAQPHEQRSSNLRSLPETLNYERGEAPPPDYVLGKEPRWTPVTLGYVTLTFSYGAPLGVAVANGFGNHTAWFALPVVGAFRWNDGRCEDLVKRGEDSNGYNNPLPILLASWQIAGLSMLLFGYGLPKKKWVRRDLALSATPLPRGGATLGVSGSF